MNTLKRWEELGQPIDYLMECWLASQSSDAQMKEENCWAVMEPSDEARENPERAWACLLFAVADARFSNAHLGLLAASTLEDLLSFHGPQFIERVEHQAGIDSRFASMLGGVWRFQMSEDIWQRVQSVWDGRLNRNSG